MTDPPSQKTFGLLVQQIECMTFMIAHAVSAMGWRVVVFADPGLNTSKQNAIYSRRLLELHGVSIELGLQSIDLDFLYIELTRLVPADRAGYYARRARQIGTVTYTDRPTWARTVLAQYLTIAASDRRLCRRLGIDV